MLLQDRYRFDPSTDLIGKGGFAEVYKAFDERLQITVALKRFVNLGSSKGSVIEEILKSISLNHPNIIRYYDFFTTSYTDPLGRTRDEEYGVMEYADSGDLGDIISRSTTVTEEEFKVILLGIIEGLHYLHKQSPPLIHRDLKPGNILLKREGGKLIPKICDFGISKAVITDKTDSTLIVGLGSMEYTAPEQLDGHLQPNTDLWAMGCILYEYFTQKSPFGKRSEGLAPQVIYANILSSEPLHGLDKVPEPYKTAIQMCLKKDAGERVQTARGLIQIFEGKYKPPVSSEDDELIGGSLVVAYAITFFTYLFLSIIIFILLLEVISFIIEYL